MNIPYEVDGPPAAYFEIDIPLHNDVHWIHRVVYRTICFRCKTEEWTTVESERQLKLILDDLGSKDSPIIWWRKRPSIEKHTTEYRDLRVRKVKPYWIFYCRIATSPELSVETLAQLHFKDEGAEPIWIIPKTLESTP